ncbi:MAG: helix-turn-helix transcriptional regulator [Bacteroidetes bacterium]|nr:helix-turn-helix transcriptional regulator [Fibrella sp.]
MIIQQLPNALFPNLETSKPDLLVYPYQVESQIDKIKVHLTKNVFSFLTVGQKDVHFSGATVSVTNQQVLLIGAGNCLMTERLSGAAAYQSTLFFFSQTNVSDFLVKYSATAAVSKPLMRTEATPYFLIEKDEFIHYFIQSLALTLKSELSQKMLNLKFEEIMLYLTERDGERFLRFLLALLNNEWEVSFRQVIEANVLSNLSLEETAFLCNMSLSTFKRHFISIYHETPGKWFQHRRLLKARELLQQGDVRVSDIFLDFGYENLSNFSAAFKQEFGISPRQAVAN